MKQFPNTVGTWIANLFGVQIMGICLLIEQFAIQMLGTMEVWYSDRHLVNEPVFRPPYEYRSAIQMPLTEHLNSEPFE